MQRHKEYGMPTLFKQIVVEIVLILIYFITLLAFYVTVVSIKHIIWVQLNEFHFTNDFWVACQAIYMLTQYTTLAVLLLPVLFCVMFVTCTELMCT